MAGKIQVARMLADKYRTTYNRGKGPDIKTEKVTINVENARSLPSACLRMRGYRGPVYVACSNDKDVEDAQYWTDGTTVGIMNSTGRILKRSTRGRWP